MSDVVYIPSSRQAASLVSLIDLKNKISVIISRQEIEEREKEERETEQEKVKGVDYKVQPEDRE